MKARPILFSAPMVRALLEGRKTQTRRIIKPPPDWGTPGPCPSVTAEGWQGPLDYSLWAHEGDQADGTPRRCPYGKPGDLLWVRETWREHDAPDQEGNVLEYRADRPEYVTRDDDPSATPWRPSIHMPRKYSRLALRITAVRVERLQKISQSDCLAEGMRAETNGFTHHVVADYRKLWTEINGADSWDTNPWVWALTFTVEKRNVDELLEISQAATPQRGTQC